jgi:KipI family sensor histidine kinase inhibitor
MTDPSDTAPDFPSIRRLGLTGMLVSFAGKMSEPANRAALAFRAAFDADWPEGVTESASSLVSCFVRFDPLRLSHERLEAHLAALLERCDWLGAPLPEGRRLWHVPTLYGTDLAPQLEEAAEAAGLDPDAAVAELSGARLRVLALGFAPGQPYLGTLPERWNLPRQTSLTAQVPVGALVLAIRQCVLFATSAPTGWRHVGQTGLAGFRLDREPPVLLRPGDEMCFPAVSRAEYDKMAAHNADGRGGAEAEDIR